MRIHTCSVCLYLFPKTEWLPFSGGVEGLSAPFFIGGVVEGGGGAKGPLS